MRTNDVKPIAGILLLIMAVLGLKRLISGRFGKFGQIGFISNQNQLNSISQLFAKDSQYISEVKRYQVPAGTYLRPRSNEQRTFSDSTICGNLEPTVNTYSGVLENGVPIQMVVWLGGKFWGYNETGANCIVRNTQTNQVSYPPGRTKQLTEILNPLEVEFLNQ